MATRTGKPFNALERSLKALTIGAQMSGQRRATGSQSEVAGEYEQQVHIPLSGSAALKPMFGDTDVTWRVPFLWAPQQRLVPFTVPHFTYGVEFTEVPTDIVVIHPAVVGWKKDVRNWFTGAFIRAAIWAPGVDEQTTVDFSATLHMTFQGYAAQPEDTGV